MRKSLTKNTTRSYKTVHGQACPQPRARDRIYDDFLATASLYRRTQSWTSAFPTSSRTTRTSSSATILIPKIHRLRTWRRRRVKASYPKIRYVKILANQRLPFEDGAFEVATSNAVLEHVGSRENQALLSLVNLPCRASRLRQRAPPLFSGRTPYRFAIVHYRKASSPWPADPLARTNSRSRQSHLDDPQAAGRVGRPHRTHGEGGLHRSAVGTVFLQISTSRSAGNAIGRNPMPRHRCAPDERYA